MMDDDSEPEITIDVQVEFYLKNRQDPIWAEFEYTIPVSMVHDMGITALMDIFLEDFLIEVNQKSSPFIVMRSSRGMRQVFWQESVQGVSIHAPDPVTVDKLIEEALNG